MRTFKLAFAGLIIMVLAMGFTNANDWFLLETKEFKVEFPKEPGFEPKMLNTAIGDLKLNIYSYSDSKTKKDDNLVYMVMSTEYPDSLVSSDNKESLPDIFKSGISSAVKKVDGELLSEKTVALDGFPGREIKISYKEGMAFLKIRFYLVKNKMYMIQIITEAKKDANPSIKRFMDSFKLNK